jgi:hypothetical protein
MQPVRGIRMQAGAAIATFDNVRLFVSIDAVQADRRQ